ncbi:type VI secretion system secreted protein VgrG [Aquabacterium commune]|uniref:Type VI secretion system secreted protein VgrG n=1 Tax=Aquabacterium commune TaxID=70586 RepID=A0A4R6RB12_9BURK|nr:type VI secretion system Vgr family protein [Aquabacterium commune]TDP82827.1 type VI secretion system secreted protein VgrG [Aquabacterium commune]
MTDLSGIQHALDDASHSLAELADRAGQGLGGLSQHTRLLRLHTALGPNVLLAERATIHEGMVPNADAHLQAACHIEVLALSTRHDLAPTELLGQAALLELQTTRDWRPFHGHISHVACLGADGGFTRWRLHIAPWLHWLGHRSDAWVFQDMDVLDITEAVFADHPAQQPAWRIDVADRSALPRRSLCTQFHETDLAFLSRLWAEEGLFAWFEHSGEAGGSHTLVIADHAQAFAPNAQPQVRYTQASATLKEDSLMHWGGVRRLGLTALHTASWDHRQVRTHSASAQVDAAHGQAHTLTFTDHPGAYAHASPVHAQRHARLRLEALEAERKQFEGTGTVRTLAPGTTFSLRDHPDHSGIDGDDDFTVLRVTHTARNNLAADATASPTQAASLSAGTDRLANDSTEPLYQGHVLAQRRQVPVRLRHAPAKPRVQGSQTAIVVGLNGPVHTDRDGRIQVQFHWQRGTRSSHRLDHPTPTADNCNAPASEASGTWVRVAQAWAGANWGGVFIPRLGQEVVVAFLDGDIDRPVVLGAAYNGQGQADAQGNSVSAGAATATGNAPAWFPGTARQGELEGHAHTATLSGLRTQSLDASQSGGGAHNQLVMDDTAAQGRVMLHTTQAQSWLQMGHLLQQDGNQRLAPRGIGLELHTQAQAALRAGSGLHLSTHARPGGTTAQAQPTDTREARTQLQAHAELLQALHTNAQAQRAQLPREAAPAQLPAQQALQATLASLGATASSEHGNIPTTGRPDIVLSAAADVHSATPAHTVIAAGQHLTVTTEQDTHLLAQRHQAWAVKGGIGLFTHGQATDTQASGQHPVTDTGIRLHAASGNVSVQAQSATLNLTAKQAVDLQSTQASVHISAPQRIVLNGAGSYLLIDGGNIELGTSGPALFKAAAKELAGGSSASGQGPSLNKAQDLFDEQFVLQDQDTGMALAGAPYRIENGKGEVVGTGITDVKGRTSRITSSRAETLKVFWGH